MKKILLAPWYACAIAIILLFSGCFKDKVSRTYTIMRPVYEIKEQVLAEIKSGQAHELKSPGKIFIRGNYLFINEINEGIHIIDNSDFHNPKIVSFINIPGNLDLAVKGNYLYADMYTDLLVIDISDPHNTKLAGNIPNVFPERSYSGGIEVDPTSVITGWITKDTTVDISDEVNGWNCRNCEAYVYDRPMLSNSAGGGKSIPGIAGSMARFSIVNNYLYAVGNTSLRAFDIENAETPLGKGEQTIGSLIETIYPFENKLFIGSASGMFIYNLHNPAQPEREGVFEHARACDPVIADDNYAFVTLRSGTTCQGFSNQLDIVDINNLLEPHLITTYNLTNPHGLAKDGNILFICDGADGIKIYNAADVNNLELLKHIDGPDTYDAIAWNNKLLVSAKDGLYQYDYSDVNNIHLASIINKQNK